MYVVQSLLAHEHTWMVQKLPAWATVAAASRRTRVVHRKVAILLR